MMDVSDLQQLLASMASSDINELNLETSEYKLHIRRGVDTIVTQAAPAPSASAPQTAPQAATEPSHSAAPTSAPSEPALKQEAPATASNLTEVKAPIVGTFYASPTPDAPPYVKVGDRVEKGAVLCIIEAMKLMNEIEAEVAGTIAEIYVRNEEPVEYGQALFAIEPA